MEAQELDYAMPESWFQDLTTDELLIVFPEDYDLWKDSGMWNITPIDSDVFSMEHPSQSDLSPRNYIIAFLLDHQAKGNNIYGIMDVISLRLSNQR